MKKIENLRAEIASLKATSPQEAEQLRIRYLSKKGAVTSLFNDFKALSPEQKRELGQKLNELKNFATETITALRDAAAAYENSQSDDDMDLFRTAAPMPLGTRHPLSLVREEIISIFARLGFTIAEGPRSRMTGTCSLRSTSRMIILRATCRTHFSSTGIPTCCSAPTHHRCRAA